MAEKMIVIDGNSLMHRAFYALPLLSNSKGAYTNAVYGFANMLFKILDERKPDYFIVAFDRKGPTFRHLEYTEYKAGRKKMPDELSPQFPLLKQLLDVLGIAVFELDGYEADDILGTFARYGDEHGIEVRLVTGDRDALQLISDYTHVLFTKKGISDVEEYDKEKLMSIYEITPQQVPDLKGLMGDSSDNIPGVPGVGEKTALKLLKEYPSVEEVLDHIEDIKGKKLKENLSQYREQALFSKKLATIDRNVPIPFDPEECRYRQPNGTALKSMLEELEFKNLLSRIKSESNNATVEKPRLEKQVRTIENMDHLLQVLEEIKASSQIAFIFGSTLSFSASPSIEYRILIKENLLDTGMEYHDILNQLKPLLEAREIKKIFHDSKKIFLTLRSHKIYLQGMAFDSAIAGYLLDPTASSYELDKLIRHYLKIEGEVGASELFLLYQEMFQQLENLELIPLYEQIELPLVEVLANMEVEGFNVDIDSLSQLGDEFGTQIERLTEEIYDLAGEEFNINSTKQLGHILFEKLDLPIIKKTKTGYSTDIEVLEQLESRHEVVAKIIEYRQMVKLKSTYMDGLLSVVDSKTHKVHSSFNQTVTATGRISSTEPNLQNIPVKVEMGRKIRKVFKASGEDYILVDADYSQIELRVLAHIAEDPVLIDAFIKNQDIHRRTASEVFNVPMLEVTETMRSSAKAVNFGIVYGISDFGLAKNLNITRKQANHYIDSYLEKYHGVKKYMDEIVDFGKKHGYVTTLMNRRRYLPELSSRNYSVRSFGERVAMNTPIQGTAADIIKKAMINVFSELRKRNMKSKLILQVHDELIVNTHRDELEEVKKIVKEQMESVLELKVPLLVDIGVGENWYDAK